MGALTIISRRSGHAERERRVLDVLAGRGFPEPCRLELADHVVFLHPKMVSATPMLAEDDAGNFVAAAGTLLYRASHGEAALARLLQDARAGKVDEAQFAGCFVVLTGIGGKLHLATDRQGLYKFFETEDAAIRSSSFLACATVLDAPRFNAQCVYEFVFQGATYGGETVLEGVSALPPDRWHGLTPDTPDKPRAFPFSLETEDLPLDAHVARMAETLRGLYGALVGTFGRNVDTALSGGYDSRLTLALLRDCGATPDVHVYGREDDPDVRVAKTIAEGEGFTLVHEDKERLGDDSPEGVARAVEAQFWAFDGCPTDGIVGSGSDLATRRARAARGRLALNGGGGEVFRNFFYMPPGRFSIRDVLWTFYCQFDPASATDRFSERRYLEALAEKVAAIFPEPAFAGTRGRLSRTQVEFIYPGFRGRFWTGRNTALNNAFGPALTPFFDTAPVRNALRVPLTYKNHGVFEAALIAAIDPKLAAYPSAYGHSFAEPPPLSARLKDWTTYMRPPRIRRLSYRFKNRMQQTALAPFLEEPHRSQYLPDGTPAMAQFFHVDSIGDSERMNRLLTLEYLAGKLGVAIP